MKIKHIIPILLFAVLAVGCKSAMPIADGTPSIKLKTREHRSTFVGGSVDLPAGVYVPDFQTDEGVYYSAPTKIIWTAIGGSRPKRGGLFIPHQIIHLDQRHGAWLDQQENSGGFIGTGATSITRVFRFDEPVSFEIQTAQPQ